MHGSKNGEIRGIRPLQRVLEDALEAGADAVEFEYVSDGLEVSYIYGNVGIGTVLVNRESVYTLIHDIVENADLQEKAHGKMSLDLFGKQQSIIVEEHDSFGESSFVLTFS